MSGAPPTPTEPTLNVYYLEIPMLLRLGALVAGRTLYPPDHESRPAFALRIHRELDYNLKSDACDHGARR